MRKIGQYIQDRRLKFKQGLQKKFIGIIKEKSNKSWKELADTVNLSEHTLKADLYREKTTMPISLARKLIKIYPFITLDIIERKWIEKILVKNWGQIKSGLMGTKPINEPVESEKLAEFVGIIIGDGHIWAKGIRVTGNSNEIAHHYYIKKLIKELFDLDARVYISYTKKSVCITNIYSKKLVSFLERMGLKKGDKIRNKTKIPSWIFKKKEFIYSVLRGLFDTDGGVYNKQKNYKRVFIEFQNHCPTTMKDINKLIKLGGFTPSQSSINTRIQNQEDVKKFFEFIGSSNPKNIIRYQIFTNGQDIPLKEELSKSVLRYNGVQPFKMRL